MSTKTSGARARATSKAVVHDQHAAAQTGLGRMSLVAAGFGALSAAVSGPGGLVAVAAGGTMAANAFKSAHGERRQARDTRLRGAAIEALASRRSGTGAFLTPKAAARTSGNDAKADAEASSKSRRAATPAASRSSGPVEVASHTRANGTRVSGYTRQRGKS